MLFAGIDISKFKHDCVIIDDSAKVVVSRFSFQNNATGFQSLLNAISQFDKEFLRIGFEATGHYGCNLKNFLCKNGYSYAEINPLLIHNFLKRKTLRKTKTDSADAKTIALYLLQEGSDITSNVPYDIAELKSLCRFRFCLKNQRKKYLLRLNNALDQVFPEFFTVFDKKLNVSAFYLLSHYGSVQAIANLNSRSYEVLRRISKGNFTLTQFVRLKQLAKNTVGVQSEMLDFEIKTVLSLLSDIDEKIEETEKRITNAITQINPPTLSIVGVSPVSAAIIISEYGDIKRFSSPGAMLSFAGLEPSVFQSGSFSASSAHMVKHGSSYLRYALINCCRTMWLHNEVFATYYYKKMAEGKTYSTTIIYLAKKLIRLIYALETKDEIFDAQKQR